MAVTFQSNLQSVLKSLDAAAKDRMREACRHAQAEVKAALTGGRSGRVYKIKGRDRQYTASAPGEAPAKRLGILRRSIRYVVIGGGLKDIKGMVGSRSFKARMLEYGTGQAGRGSTTDPESHKHGESSGMAARPFLKPTLLRERENLAKIIGEDWQK